MWLDRLREGGGGEEAQWAGGGLRGNCERYLVGITGRTMIKGEIRGSAGDR